MGDILLPGIRSQDPRLNFMPLTYQCDFAWQLLSYLAQLGAGYAVCCRVSSVGRALCFHLTVGRETLTKAYNALDFTLSIKKITLNALSSSSL